MENDEALKNLRLEFSRQRDRFSLDIAALQDDLKALEERVGESERVVMDAVKLNKSKLTKQGQDQRRIWLAIAAASTGLLTLIMIGIRSEDRSDLLKTLITVGLSGGGVLALVVESKVKESRENSSELLEAEER